MSESKADIHSRSDADASAEAEEGLGKQAPTPANGRSLEADATASGPPEPPTDSPSPVRIDNMKDRQLGDYQLLRRIGHGGMAEVYLAEQLSLKRNVAVKVLREEMHADAVHLQRFEQEAKAAGGLNHPNIVQVYSIGQDDGLHFIAQEYVPGMNLREYLTRQGPPDLKTAVKFMRQMASALEAAADAGIVHRDVKPENVLITRKNEVKVTDFGLAQLALGERLNLTQVGMTMGTPLYMSPEQVNGRNIDFRSDIYSLGVTAYHMLCGATPFRGETAISVAVQHVNKEPPQLKQQRADLPDVVCQLVHRMMAKNPDDRYQTAAALVGDLERIERALSENPAALARMRLTDEGMPRSTPWWISPFAGWSLTKRLVAFSLLALTTAAAGAMLGWQRRPADPFTEPVPPPESNVQVEETALLQLFRASFLRNDEDAYKAVLENFKGPQDALYRRRAKEGLAMLYIRTRRYQEAKEIYTEFTQEDDKDESLVATGYAGLAVVESLEGDYVASQRMLLKYEPVSRLVHNDELTNLIRLAKQRNIEKLGQQIPQELEDGKSPARND